MRNVPLGIYVPGQTFIHRCPPAIKLLILFLFVILTAIAVKTIPIAALCVALPAVGMLLAQIPPRIIAGQIGPPLIILVPIALFQWWATTGHEAMVMFLTVFAAIIAAVLVTLTTTIEEMMGAFTKLLAPFEKVGLPVETITLAMTLTIRLLPLMMATVGEVLEARKARGAGFSLAAFGTPIIIRSIRRARAMGEALAARGVGD